MYEAVIVCGVLVGDASLEVIGFEWGPMPTPTGKMARIPFPLILTWRDRNLGKIAKFPIMQYKRETIEAIKEEATLLLNARLMNIPEGDKAVSLFAFYISHENERLDIVGVNQEPGFIEIACDFVFQDPALTCYTPYHIFTGTTEDIDIRTKEIIEKTIINNF